MKGTVKWFNTKKGFGFITSEDGKDFFVHYSDIKSQGFKNLEEKEEVEFQIGAGDKGEKAINVMKKNMQSSS